jgi:hypothetical protein
VRDEQPQREKRSSPLFFDRGKLRQLPLPIVWLSGVIGIITGDLSAYVRIKGRHRPFLPVLCSCAYSPPYTLTHNCTFSDFSYLTSLRKRANIRNSYHDL